MGTVWSTETQNEEVKSKKLQPGYQEEAKEEHDYQVQKQMEEQNRKFQETFNVVEESIKTDTSVPNLVDNYAKLRTIVPPNIHSLGDFVENMKDVWAAIMSHLDAIRKFGDDGREQAKTMERIHLDYWRLLLKTRSKIQIIMTRCKIQKRNITGLLSILKDARDPKKTVSPDDQLAYQDCINCLSMWLRSDNVQSILEEWKKMTKRLLKAKHDWESLVKGAETKARNFVYACIGLAAAVSCVVVAVLYSTCGVEPGEAWAAVGTGRDVLLASFETIVGSGSAAIASAVAIINQANGLNESLSVAIKLQERLEMLLKQSLKMEEKLSAVDDACANTSEQANFMKDSKSSKRMEPALEDLEEYLDEYMNQGKKVMQTIQESAEKFINV
eukprot:37865_1